MGAEPGAGFVQSRMRAVHGAGSMWNRMSAVHGSVWSRMGAWGTPRQSHSASLQLLPHGLCLSSQSSNSPAAGPAGTLGGAAPAAVAAAALQESPLQVPSWGRSSVLLLTASQWDGWCSVTGTC